MTNRFQIKVYTFDSRFIKQRRNNKLYIIFINIQKQNYDIDYYKSEQLCSENSHEK